ncbi:glycosyltransferase family 4 protein [Agrobacterium rhizogenes]|nr:glycosyltransferase family 1 protein [Agrobacterium sp. ICMP 7243]NTF52046.1 glycosyltransferase family 4 protein [Rhizobium rhizogenes]NTF90388.1 glycosyltransferase family 4 protein [Rhizobium rhizogenes]NTG17590.1 glycosyltransferase family 4 protein [Rhizobium rhizogenes]NTG24250.1 glycosyltransferase family 4 protein [Rhizobium rhizogenes]
MMVGEVRVGQTILYDGLNLSLKKGTGVATYTRSLMSTAQALGYKTGVVHGIQGNIPRDPMLREVILFDDSSERPTGPLFTARRWLRRRIAAPFGVKPVPIPLNGTVILKSLQAQLGDSGLLYASNDLFNLARHHFKRYGNNLALSFEQQPDLLHCTYPMPIAAKKALNVYTIHDLVPLRLPYLTEDDKRYHYRMLRSLVKRADHIITVSETSRDDIIKVLGVDEKRVSNTYQAVQVPDALRAKPDDVVADEIAGIFHLDWKGYFLFFGAFEPKKNIARLIEAYLASKTDLPLIIVGAPGWKGDATQELIDDERFRFFRRADDRIIPQRQIQRFDFVSYPLLISLIRGARAVLFPSLYEGFGLPVLESMQLGTPVLSSTEGSIPEIAGKAALLVDPYNTDDMRKAISSLAQDDGLCSHFAEVGPKQAARFSADQYNQRVGELYNTLFHG